MKRYRVPFFSFRKEIMVMVIFLLTVKIYALDFSAGAGGQFSALFSSMRTTYRGDSFTEYLGTVRNWGIFAFFDMNYIEIDAGLFYSDSANYAYYDGLSGIGLGLYGKYPFYVRNMELFPLFGFGYDIYLNSNYDWSDKGKLNSLLMKGGIGARYPIDKTLYVYGSILYDFKLFNGYERDIKRNSRNVEFDFFTHGPEFRIALGYKF
jgi:hypothetical protein